MKKNKPAGIHWNRAWALVPVVANAIKSRAKIAEIIRNIYKPPTKRRTKMITNKTPIPPP